MKKWIAVFCASAAGTHSEYMDQARALGHAIAERGYGLVYGGATVGAMGAVADAALEVGGAVMGVIPGVLTDREIEHRGLAELHVVGSMHERKAMMAERADAFLALPGGFGTLDEFIEVLTWAQLRIHAKPCVLVNVRGYYDGLLSFLDKGVAEGFLKAENRRLIQVAGDAEEALQITEKLWAVSSTEAHDARLDELVK
jgi:uncharacterized protein (TIGR00730 family)